MGIAQTLVHYGLHLLMPGLVAWVLFRSRWRRAWLIMLATMAVDLDHLMAYPEVFVPERCSVGFHPLHSYPAIALYLLLLGHRRTRLVAVGLLLHMFTDFQDCVWTSCLSR